ncbi:RagB/SusD family nutrient uptake outer membrane protein [Dyadobacter bucti]|uniref:RagB/SusD family nutrient uptake outer membrane protein n=1 Tax=Dyadobacter bucti TaxID=2572203 RepID=UPI001108067A|nr:RagB/SusD family nutrient uptake outer membrane protein [Dyadobacter bucti]
MKKILSIAAMTASLLLGSCGKDFIDLQPVSTVSVDVLYKTDKDFQDAVIGGYATLQTQYQTFWIFGDIRGDDAEQQIVKNDAWSTSDAFLLFSDANILRDSWRNYFSIINRMNTILVRIEDADPAVVTNKNRHVAEAKFLRALAYFDLVRIFGDVPLLTRPITTDEAYKTKRESADAIYDQIIIRDLIDADQGLLAKYSGTEVGRATKGAAKSLLGKVYLTRKDFVKAEVALQEVTAMGYSLLTNYNDLFDYTKDEHHSEYIFDIEYDENKGEGSVFTNRFLPNSNLMAQNFGVQGVGTETNSPSDELISLFVAGDLRKDVSVGVKGGFIDKNGVFVALPQSTSQTYTKKYLTAEPAFEDSRANWKVTRYADVLLMYAEALNENGKSAPAHDMINMVRKRAGVPAYAGLTQSDLREKIYLERRLELSFEGHRWFDLVRTGRAYEKMKSKNMQPFMNVFAIPLGQLQVINDESIFAQNPGYN